jgi:alpha-L-fucosidase
MHTTRRKFLAGSTLALASAATHAEILPAGSPAPFGALPKPRQISWQRMETTAFLHFGVNTFTDREWGNGDEDPNIFNPTDFNADAIVSALKDGGIKGVILTCKHHDGFCLWPTQSTEHCIRHSSWKDGKGDVVREVSAAAARHGLKFGVYVSPWDRSNPHYGKPEYINIYRQQITELLSNYGPIFEIWFDGANGGLGYYGGANETRTIDKLTFYDWPNTWALVRKLQPDICIFSDVGPDIRWVGNERGVAGETCWATYDPMNEAGTAPGAPGDVKSNLNTIGTLHGTRWLPAECDVSIRPGWFWHAAENAKVKTPAQLVDLYFKSVGRGAELLLNVPPNRTGNLSAEDVASLAGFNRIITNLFRTNLAASARLIASNIRANSKHFAPGNLLTSELETYWATDDSILTPTLTLDFHHPVHFDVLRLGEAIQLGQRIESFTLESFANGAWSQLAAATSIGNCRLIKLDQPVATKRLRLSITKSAAPIALASLGLYLTPAM